MHQGLSYRVARALLRLLVRATTRPAWTGTRRLPAEGGVLVAVNHLSFWDPVVIAYFVDEHGRSPRFLAKSELFDVPVLGRILRGAGQIPVRRASAAASRAGADADAAIRRGECVVVYPEGTLTFDPQLWPMRARTGTARIALATGAPVIPMAQWGIQVISPPWSKRIRPVPRHDVRVLAGDPVDLADLYGLPVGRSVLEEATERIMAAITGLLAELRGESPPETRWDPRTMGPEAARPAGRPADAGEERNPPTMNTASDGIAHEGLA